MKRLLLLASLILGLCICSCTTEKASTKDEIGDEEYRVMSAVLKSRLDERETYQPPDRAQLIGFRFDRAESLRIARKIDVEEARMKSLYDRFGSLAWLVCMDKVRPKEFYDTLIQRFGRRACRILRDSSNAKVAYDSLYRKYGNLDYFVVLQGETGRHQVDSSLNYMTEFKGKIPPALIMSFNENNRESHVLKRERFGESLVIELFSEGDFDSTLTAREFWEAFFERIPLADGIFSVTRVGFSSDTTSALVGFSAYSGPLSGYASYILLTKKNDRWEVDRERVMVVR